MIEILLVEDDHVLARGLQVNLELEGYTVTWAQSLAEALKSAEARNYSLVILDLGLPDGSGFDFVTKKREQKSSLPIIILTAQADEDSVVEGLQRGANDYMRKPFGNKELLARIKATLRFAQNKEITSDDKIRFDDLSISPDQRQVTYKESPLSLHRREFDILLKLMQRAETIVSREMILQVLDKEGEIFDRTIDSHVSHIRSKFRSAGVSSIKITSVYGLGYRLEKV